MDATHEIARLRAKVERLTAVLRQIEIDCLKVMNDEICSEAERRTWLAVARVARAALAADGKGE